MQKTSHKNFNCWLLIASFLIISIYSMEGLAMSLFSRTDVVLFSPMEGKMTFEGKPAANAKIVRTIIWKGDEGETDVFYTAEDGTFKLPIKRAKVRIPLLAEFVLTQEVSVFYNDQEFSIWVRSKSDLGEYGELGGKPKNFRCELTDKRVRLEEFWGLFGTSCKWDSIEKQGE
jgi:hypothetical protein